MFPMQDHPMTSRTLALASALLIASTAQAHEYAKDGIAVLHPFALETSDKAMTGAGYFEIRNDGETADALIAVEADFPRVMLHSSVEEDGMMKMEALERLEIAPGETVTLTPGTGVHVMFMGLDGDPFEVDERIPARLVFEKAGEVEVEFVVESRSETEAAEGAELDMSHESMDHESH